MFSSSRLSVTIASSKKNGVAGMAWLASLRRFASRTKRPSQYLIENHRLGRDHVVESVMECGIALQTSEVKSLSEKKCDLSSAHVQIVNNEAMLMDAHIPEHAGCLPFHVHLPTRPRKLLLHKKEIRKLDEFLSAADADVLASKFRVGDTGWIKLDIALCKRKKAADSREADQTRMWNRERTNFLKNG